MFFRQQGCLQKRSALTKVVQHYTAEVLLGVQMCSAARGPCQCQSTGWRPMWPMGRMAGAACSPSACALAARRGPVSCHGAH